MFYSLEGPLDDVHIESISLGSYSCIVDENIDFSIFILDYVDEIVDALVIWDIQLLQMKLSLRIFVGDLSFCLFTEL